VYLTAADGAGQRIVVHAGDVLELVAVLVVSMVAIVLAYRAMQRPRLVLHPVAPRRYRARRRDVVQYAVSMPLLLTLWTTSLELILIFTNNGLSAAEVTSVSSAIVVAVRLFAHLSHEHAHELAKSIPLTIVTLLIVTSNGWRSEDGLFELGRDLDRTDVTLPAILVVIGAEFLICAVWYWGGVRWWYERGHDVPGLPRQVHEIDPEHDLADRLTMRRTPTAPPSG
jgi:hypothetical protein